MAFKDEFRFQTGSIKSRVRPYLLGEYHVFRFQTGSIKSLSKLNPH